MTSTDNQVFSALDEPRLIGEEGIAARIATLAAPVATSLGFRLVRVRQSGSTMQVMAERADGSFTIDDCEKLSRMLSPVLDAEDPISGSYNLEVSSPGIDRPLVRVSDFKRWAGQELKIEFTQMIEGRKRARGFIASADDAGIMLQIEDMAEPLHVAYTAIADAKLVMSDQLIKEAQKRAAKGVTDGATIDANEHDDITLKEDRRKFHGRQR